ncbi:MAG: SBBP repeat-containing protein [candidate division KSB1 bacterium]|nr:SBBP repeat-containing protein [candidate division KSB1 bacterium]MDZ7313089.1 SBBP repeat-containing protein [candidate division KSB1 bacterium]
MKTLIIVFLLVALVCAAFIHAQNSPWKDGRPMRPARFERPRLEGQLGNRFSSRERFRGRESFHPWLHLPDVLDSSPLSQAQSLSDSVQEAWVSHYASQLFSDDDEALAVVTDDSGNVYVTGWSGRSGRSGRWSDYATVKYNASGVLQWVAGYSGPENSEDKATALAVDDSGNVYVTGWSGHSSTMSDYATVKYNASGVLLWVARYSGPGSSEDKATALAVDASGNVYVTGRAGDDYATIKYNSAGIEQWVARYNGREYGMDAATALAVDDSGNVYVTGWSKGSGMYSDYATVKYNSSGILQWVARYNGPGNHDDWAKALVVDGSGNVYVTGWSGGLGTYRDYATVKYNSAGVEQWVVRYDSSDDEAVALAVDRSGNVYVTGRTGSYPQYDCATVKYNSAGVQQWVAGYNGSGDSTDVATALALDGSGNVYVAGWSWASGTNDDYVIIKYNSEGIEQWVSRYNGQGSGPDRAMALAVDDSGNAFVAGWSWDLATRHDYATVKYNSAGVQQWEARYNGPASSHDNAAALGVDASGNVYVTGTSVSSGTWGYATVKYNSAGVEQWVARYNSSSGDEAVALAMDDSGNVYVTGQSRGSGTHRDYATVKYNFAGVEQWVARYNGPGNSDDLATALAVDPSGNVYVTGWSWGSGTGDDYVTVKYSSAGIEQWVARYNGPADWDDKATALAVDVSGNVYVTGWSWGSAGTRKDYATVKYNSEGVEQWVARYKGPESDEDLAAALAIDASGNVYVTGQSGWVTNFDYVTVKYNSEGVEQWVARYNGPVSSEDEAVALAVDASGNVYVTGWSLDSVSRGDYATVKYDSTGAQQWVARYGGLREDSDDRAMALAVDASGNVYVTGLSGSRRVGIFWEYDYATVKYNSAGVQEWVARYDGPESSNDWPVALDLDISGNVYVTGTSSGESWSIYTTIKYVQTPVFVEKEEPGKPRRYWLAQNYPNPFNTSTTVRYAIAKSGHVTLKVFNLQGQEIATLVSETKPAGEYEIKWNPNNLPSSVYVYRLQAGEFAETKKLLLLK